VPGAFEEQALLRAVAQLSLVVDGAAEFVARDADLVQPLGDLARGRPRQRQVVRAERAGQSRNPMD